MGTRIEKSRSPKRVQATMLWDVSDAAFVTVTGKPNRLDHRGFPNKNGADTTRVTYTSQA